MYLDILKKYGLSYFDKVLMIRNNFIFNFLLQCLIYFVVARKFILYLKINSEAYNINNKCEKN